MTFRILVIEDDYDAQECLEHDCGEFAFECTYIIDLESALDLVETCAGNFDGVLLDGLIFADKSCGATASSLSIADELRRRQFPGPIIAMSGLGSLRRQLLASGCTHEAEKWDAASLMAELLGAS